MRSQQLLWLLAILAMLSACSLLVDFDPEGQPCSSPPEQCFSGYVCVDGGCVSAPSASPDGGTGGSSLCEDPAGCPQQPPEAR
jgi:hypothetical protein